MQKDKLTLENIKKDLMAVANTNLSINSGWRIESAIIFVIIALALIFGFKLFWLGLISLAVATFPAVRFLIDYKKYNDKRKQLMNTIDRGGISISVEKLSHFSEETVRERRLGDKDGMRIDYFLYFMSGVSWRIPKFFKHYEWSKDYYISTEGLKNIAVRENEYFFVTLQGYAEIAYAYPCDFFELDEQLKQK